MYIVHLSRGNNENHPNFLRSLISKRVALFRPTCARMAYCHVCGVKYLKSKSWYPGLLEEKAQFTLTLQLI